MEYIAHNRKALEAPAFHKIRIRLGDYVALSKREQIAHIVELLAQDSSSVAKHGVNRFEALLDPLGLSGEIPKDVARTLFELQQVRNVIAHKNGRCDRRLRASCPWLKVKIGSNVSIGPGRLNAYGSAAREYVLEVLYRIGDMHGMSIRPTSGGGG